MSVTIPKHVQRLVECFSSILQKDKNVPLTSDAEYMQLTELRFLIKNVRECSAIQLYQSFSKCATVTRTDPVAEAASASTGSTLASAILDSKEMDTKISELDLFLTDLYVLISSRLNAARQLNDSKTYLPRIVRLCERLRLHERESDLLHLLVACQGSDNSNVLNSLSEEDYLRRITGFQRITNMADVDIDLFCDADRQHIKEGLILVEEDNGQHFNLRLPRTAIQLLYGRPVKADDLLKVSQTCLEDIILSELYVDSSSNNLLLSEYQSTQQQTTGHHATEDDDEYEHALVKMLVKGEEDDDEEDDDDDEEDEDFIDDDNSAELEEADEELVVIVDGSDAIVGSERQRGINRSTEATAAVAVTVRPAKKRRRDPSIGIAEDIVLGTPSKQLFTLANAHHNSSTATLGTVSTGTTGIGATVPLSAPSSPTAFKPYRTDFDQLEYMEDCFALVALMIRGNAARMKDDMRKEGTKMSSWDYNGEVKHGKRELQAKLRVQEGRMLRRVQATKEAHLPAPRLEIMAEQLQLDGFEKKLIMLVIGKTVSPVVKMLMETLDGGARADDTVSVGQALAILCQDFNTQVANRKYFYKSGRLMKNGIISLQRSRWHQGGGDLTDNRIVLDRRVLDNAVGLDSEINELVEGSDLYTPQVNLSQVVLPPGHLESVLAHCKAYDRFIKLITNSNNNSTTTAEGDSDSNSNSNINSNSSSSGVMDIDPNTTSTSASTAAAATAAATTTTELSPPSPSLTPATSAAIAATTLPSTIDSKQHLSKKVAYGNGLVILLCGKSGTGKTMTVNAVANELGKKVLLVDFGGLTGKKSDGGGDLDADLRGLFREAKMSNAVLFFDECETVFRTRDRGGDRMLNSLLTEIEKHEGIVFLATNRPYDLDEAMHRRITCVLEYRPPDAMMRRQIWQNIVASIGAVSVSSSSITGTETSAEAATTTTASSSTSSNSKPQITLAEDVDFGALSVKYELTGGFIKNAIQSSLLSAIHRNSDRPIITQNDLIEGCKLQMRGSLHQKGFEPKVVPQSGSDVLHLSPTVRNIANAVVRFEKSRACVYGSWANASNDNSNNSTSNSSSNSHNNSIGNSIISSVNSHSGQQKACIVGLAGPAGSGKKTLLSAIAYDLGKNIRVLHCADILQNESAEGGPLGLRVLTAAVNDARLSDAMIAIDGFEHVLDCGSKSEWKLDMLLSRVLDCLHRFPGCVCLLCTVDNPQHLTLQRDFASKLFAFIKLLVPPADIRAKLWKSLMPIRAPLHTDVNFIELGRRYELHAGSIQSAVARACAEAAGRCMSILTPIVNNTTTTTNGTASTIQAVTQADLLAAGSAEVKKLTSSEMEFVSSMFM